MKKKNHSQLTKNDNNNRRTGSLRPTSGPFYGKRSRGNGTSVERHKRKPPRGMYINHDDIVALACPDNESANSNRNDDLLASMDREISTLLSQVCRFFKYIFFCQWWYIVCLCLHFFSYIDYFLFCF